MPPSVTDQIISAWDDEEAEGAVVEQPAEEQPEEVVEEEQPEPDQEDGEEAEEEDAQEDEEEAVEEGEDEETAEEEPDEFSDDPQVIAYLAKYQNDPERALKAAVQLQQALGRQGQEKAVLTRRVQELEAEIAQQQAFQVGQLLSPEQQTWVEEAIGSQNPGNYVQQAVRAGEFDLARAVCAEWAREQPYEAMRVSQAVDGAEYNMHAQQYTAPTEEPVDHSMLLNALVDNFPDMPLYEQQMLTTLNNLGPGHPLVQDAQSADFAASAKAIINLYEIARARTATVKSTRERLNGKAKTDAAEARRRAVVSSSQATPGPSETPRAATIMPGLTLQQLDAEWEKE